ncbi:hypothetical protein FRC97_21580 [Paracidovorax citrulli]|nr:hypothetical protein FRC75_10985 [Paracidovorax citrulli]UMT87943.1 hypothetical protein FRC90_07555 [Paracidovorax citrulli]UMT97357.1 hypothetical protein FRC97_21580 [Paracidovorax citrulli]
MRWSGAPKRKCRAAPRPCPRADRRAAAGGGCPPPPGTPLLERRCGRTGAMDFRAFARWLQETAGHPPARRISNSFPPMHRRRMSGSDRRAARRGIARPARMALSDAAREARRVTLGLSNPSMEKTP